MALGSGRVSTNNFACAKWIVDTNGIQNGATHSTIASAIASAASGDTIVIKPGTYTEDFTIPAGIHLTALGGAAETFNVIIKGKITMTEAGGSTISNIRLDTNADNVIAITGSNAVVLKLDNCEMRVIDATGITMNNANASLNLKRCNGNIQGNYATFVVTSCSAISFDYTNISNGVSTTTSTIAAGGFYANYSSFQFPMSSSGSANFFLHWCLFGQMPSATIPITTSGTGANHSANFCLFDVGGASACISIGSGTTMQVIQCTCRSTGGVNVLTGAGTMIYANIVFLDSTAHNVTTETAKTVF